MRAHLSARRRLLLAGGAGLISPWAAALTLPMVNGERRLLAWRLRPSPGFDALSWRIEAAGAPAPLARDLRLLRRR